MEKGSKERTAIEGRDYITEKKEGRGIEDNRRRREILIF
jgi:hypothetical protein